MTTAPDLVAGGRAEEVAVGFVDTLRRSGLEVSLTSSRLYVAALAEVGLADPAAVYWAGRATLVHRPEDVEIHDRAFVAYWGRLPVALRWRPPGDPERLTLAVDDPDGLPGDPGEPAPADDTVTVRYSATEVLTRKDFALYSDDELAEAHELMARIRLRGEHRPSRRRLRSPRHRGPLDLRRTVRDALRAGGEPVRLRRRRRAERPRRLVLLLDVSGSMEPYARALIRFVHAAVAGRTRVEAFALGTRLTRLTRELSQRDPDRALEAAAEAVVDWSGGTRLGEALARFNDEWGCRGMARGAVVVILSDGWDRGDPATMDEQMRRLHRVAHRVVWVNPLKATPGYAPLARGMAAALPHVDEFIEGHSIESLEHLADVVLGRSGGRDRHGVAAPPAGEPGQEEGSAAPPAVIDPHPEEAS